MDKIKQRICVNAIDLDIFLEDHKILIDDAIQFLKENNDFGYFIYCTKPTSALFDRSNKENEEIGLKTIQQNMLDQPLDHGEYCVVLYKKDLLRYIEPFMYGSNLHYSFKLKNYLWDQIEEGRPKEELDYDNHFDAMISSNWFRRIKMLV